jgi:ATP-dependent DNA helicase RecQ
LQQLVGYCHAESCLQQYILNYFGETDATSCGTCGNCTDDRESVNVTREAQMIFSCVKRMKERFGKTMIAKVLTGSLDQKIKSFGFDRISTFGIMKNKTQKQVMELIDFFTAEQYLLPTNGAYPVLTLTKKAIEVLQNERDVLKKEQVQAEQFVVDDALFTRLRNVRKRLANAEHVPPFVIFSDATLRDMCAQLPTTVEAMLNVKGVGQRKLDSFGSIFIREIADYCKQNGIEPMEERKISEPPRVKRQKPNEEKSYYVTYQLYNKGYTIEEIAKERGLSPSTIEQHLVTCDDKGFNIEWEQFIDPQYEPMIAQVVSEVETERLTPIKEQLPEEVGYFMIRAYLQKQKEHSKKLG